MIAHHRATGDSIMTDHAQPSPRDAVRDKVTEIVRAKWLSFLILGLLLSLGGILSIALPVVSTLAVSLTVGILLAACGLVQIVQSFQSQGWRGFLWHLGVGVVQVVGGVLIYMDPFAGAIAITLLIAIVLATIGLSQIGLAWRVRPHDGWGWLMLAGIVAVAAGLVLALKLPVAGLTTPGIMVGISLLFSGTAYLAIALAARRIAKRLAA
jgi:uncharacterized membrane protein HdeD (DUF308 family)